MAALHPAGARSETFPSGFASHQIVDLAPGCLGAWRRSLVFWFEVDDPGAPWPEPGGVSGALHRGLDHTPVACDSGHDAVAHPDRADRADSRAPHPGIVGICLSLPALFDLPGIRSGILGRTALRRYHQEDLHHPGLYGLAAPVTTGDHFDQRLAAAPQKGLEDATQADLSGGDSRSDPLHLAGQGRYAYAACLFFDSIGLAGISAALVATVCAAADKVGGAITAIRAIGISGRKRSQPRRHERGGGVSRPEG